MGLPRPVQRLASITVGALFSVVLGAANAQPSPPESHSTPQKQSATHDKQSAADHAGPQDDQTASLAKAVQNPVASLISVPLQNNTNFDIGPNNRTQNILNLQPVIPVRVSENWNLIMRIITPVIYQPSIPSLLLQSNTPFNHLGTLGLGDMNPTFFLSPSKPKKLIWGIGPTFLLRPRPTMSLGRQNGASDLLWFC